jgi:hypothetical protein
VNDLRKATSAVAAAVLLLSAPTAAWAGPTCADTMGIANHGHHVVHDYVSGLGHETTEWPPDNTVGPMIAGSGAVLPGGPGPGFHFPEGIAPGASFCTGSQSPGAHL